MIINDIKIGDYITETVMFDWHNKGQTQTRTYVVTEKHDDGVAAISQFYEYNNRQEDFFRICTLASNFRKATSDEKRICRNYLNEYVSKTKKEITKLEKIVRKN